MNSKQLNFYASPDELEEHLKFISSFDSYISYEPLFGKDYQRYQGGGMNHPEQTLHQLIIFQESEFSSNIKTQFIKEQNYYLFDLKASNIIQFTFPKIKSESELIRSRFYYITAYRGDGKIIEKDPKFIEWADKLIRAFRRKFLISKTPTFKEYSTATVEQLVNAGHLTLRQL